MVRKYIYNFILIIMSLLDLNKIEFVTLIIRMNKSNYVDVIYLFWSLNLLGFMLRRMIIYLLNEKVM